MATALPRSLPATGSIAECRCRIWSSLMIGTTRVPTRSTDGTLARILTAAKIFNEAQPETAGRLPRFRWLVDRMLAPLDPPIRRGVFKGCDHQARRCCS
jgi:hypothetical protein